MKAQDLLSVLQNNPDAVVIFQSQPYEEHSLNEVTVAHVYQKGDLVFERGENFTDHIDEELSLAQTTLIVLS